MKSTLESLKIKKSKSGKNLKMKKSLKHEELDHDRLNI